MKAGGLVYVQKRSNFSIAAMCIILGRRNVFFWGGLLLYMSYIVDLPQGESRVWFSISLVWDMV